MLTVSDITSFLFAWAPKALAWEKDNVGLIVGDPAQPVMSVLVTLDVTREIIDEAVERGANVIVSHHPPIFQPVKTIREDGIQGSLLALAIRSGIALIAMHTNADAAQQGLNAALAEELGLIDVRPLDSLDGLNRRLTVWIRCTGTAGEAVERFVLDNRHLRGFMRTDGEDVLVLEMDVEEWVVNDILTRIAAIPGASILEATRSRIVTSAHEHGIGAIGRLPEPAGADAFALIVRETLRCASVRTGNGNPARVIRTVAVCGGSGASLIGRAVAEGADAYVTADLKYHDFMDNQHDLLLIDAGHYETERPFIRRCAAILSEMRFPGSEKISILSTSKDTNPVRFV